MASSPHLLGRLLAISGVLTAGAFGGDKEAQTWREKMAVLTPASYVAPHFSTPPAIDGTPDEACWKTAPWTNDFVDISTQVKPRFRTRAKMGWDENALYIAAELEEPHVWATLTEHDSVIFHDPDFEVFIDPDGDTHRYSELELNALNTTWDLLLNRPYQDLGNPDNTWELHGLKTAVAIQGTLNQPADTDHGWTVEIAIPWAAFAPITEGPPAATVGKRIRLNFSRVEWQVTYQDGHYKKTPGVPEDNWVWTPQGVIDMHRPEMWGVVELGEGAATSAAPVPAAAARARAFEIYYAQRDLREAGLPLDGKLTALALPPPAAGLEEELTLEGDHTVARVRSADGTWLLRSDRLLTFLKP